MNIIDREFLLNLVNSKVISGKFPWETYNLIAKEENLKVIEEFVKTEIINKPEDNIENKYYLNLIYTLGKIGGLDTYTMLNNLMLDNLKHKDLVLEILNALADILSRIVDIDYKNIQKLKEIIEKYSESDILSSVAYILKLYKNNKLGLSNKAFTEYSKTELIDLIK